MEQICLYGNRLSREPERLRVNQLRTDQTSILARHTDCRQTSGNESVHEALVHNARQHHSKKLEILFRSDAAPSDEYRFPTQRSLHCGHFITAAVHDAQFSATGLPRVVKDACQIRMGLSPPSDLRD